MEKEELYKAIRRMPIERLIRVRMEPLLEKAARGDTPFLSVIVGHVERALIKATLERSAGKLGEAADLLGIHRNTLRSKIREHRISTGTKRKPRGRSLPALRRRRR